MQNFLYKPKLAVFKVKKKIGDVIPTNSLHRENSFLYREKKAFPLT